MPRESPTTAVHLSVSDICDDVFRVMFEARPGYRSLAELRPGCDRIIHERDFQIMWLRHNSSWCVQLDNGLTSHLFASDIASLRERGCLASESSSNDLSVPDAEKGC